MNWGFDRFTTNWSTRVDAHILVAFLAYSLQVTLKHRLLMHAPGLTPAAVLEKLASIQMIDVHLPTVDGRRLILPCYTQPDTDVKILLDKLRLAREFGGRPAGTRRRRDRMRRFRTWG